MSLRKQKRVYVTLRQPLEGGRQKTAGFTIYDVDLAEVERRIKEAFEQ